VGDVASPGYDQPPLRAAVYPRLRDGTFVPPQGFDLVRARVTVESALFTTLCQCTSCRFVIIAYGDYFLVAISMQVVTDHWMSCASMV